MTAVAQHALATGFVPVVPPLAMGFVHVQVALAIGYEHVPEATAIADAEKPEMGCGQNPHLHCVQEKGRESSRQFPSSQKTALLHLQVQDCDPSSPVLRGVAIAVYSRR